jgi:hypothetical protein
VGRLLALTFAVGLVLGSSAGATGPGFRSTSFVRRVDNPWFPLVPGTVYVYTGVKDGKSSRDVVTVTHRTRQISGVAATELRTISMSRDASRSARRTAMHRTVWETSGI